MSGPGQIMWGKWLMFTTVIMASGYGIMKIATPTDQELYDALAPDLKRKVDEIRAQRAGSSAVRKRLESAGQQDQIVWAEQLGSTKPGSGSRRV